MNRDEIQHLTALPIVGLAGEGLQSLGANKRKAQPQTPEPPQACSYLAKLGITPEHLQPSTFIPIDFACTEALRSDTLMIKAGNYYPSKCGY